MSVADVPAVPAAGVRPAEQPRPMPGPPPSALVPAAPPAPIAPAAPRPDAGGHGPTRTAGRLLAGAFAAAWVLCPAVEPMPAHDLPYPLWQVPIDVAAVAAILGAVVALWRGGRHAARLGLAAGALMAVETTICPYAGHTPIGWWTWVQAALSLGVMAASVVLYRLRPAADGR